MNYEYILEVIEKYKNDLTHVDREYGTRYSFSRPKDSINITISTHGFLFYYKVNMNLRGSNYQYADISVSGKKAKEIIAILKDLNKKREENMLGNLLNEAINKK